MKKLFIILLIIVLAGCSNNVNLGGDNIIDEEIVNIHEFEKLYKEIEKKHKQVKRYEKNNSKYLVNEYVTPSDGVGYQIIKDDGINIESVCIGADCLGKNFIQLIASTTTE